MYTGEEKRNLLPDSLPNGGPVRAARKVAPIYQHLSPFHVKASSSVPGAAAQQRSRAVTRKIRVSNGRGMRGGMAGRDLQRLTDRSDGLKRQSVVDEPW
jgi:hypothetical protein